MELEDVKGLFNLRGSVCISSWTPSSSPALYYVFLWGFTLFLLIKIWIIRGDILMFLKY